MKGKGIQQKTKAQESGLGPRSSALKRLDGWPGRVARFLGPVVLALLAFAAVLLIFGKNPMRAYVEIFSSTLGSTYGFSEVLVKMIPLTLCAAAVALPARIWLINVGGEGQFYIGALFAAWGALNFPSLPAWLLIPWISVLGFLGGGLWALISGVLRARGWVSETISTLLLNYVAILLVSFFVFGPWKDPESANYPQSAPFAAGRHLARLFRDPGPPGNRVLRGRPGSLPLRAFPHPVGAGDARHRRQRRSGTAQRDPGRPVHRDPHVHRRGDRRAGGDERGFGHPRPASAQPFPGVRVHRFSDQLDGRGERGGNRGRRLSPGHRHRRRGHPPDDPRVPGSVVNILMAIILFVILARKGGAR